MGWRRILTVALLLYLVADYSDPSMPGVFSLAADPLFLDGALDARVQPATARPDIPSLPAAASFRMETAHAEPPAVLPPRLPFLPVPRGHARMVPALSTDARSEDHEPLRSLD